jgi:hypothetical protein
MRTTLSSDIFGEGVFWAGPGRGVGLLGRLLLGWVGAGLPWPAQVSTPTLSFSFLFFYLVFLILFEFRFEFIF